jgi:Uma2 family endonuclease
MLMYIETERKQYSEEELRDKIYQIIGGEAVVVPSPSPFHQDIVSNIFEKLRPFVRANRLGKVLLSPLDIRFEEGEVYQPDVAFIAQSKLKGVTKEAIETLPDLVIEVLSPSTAYYDLTHKKEVYAKHGVAEYWIVDPIELTIEVLMNEGNLYRTDRLLRKPAILESTLLPGFSMSVEDVFVF